MSYPYPEEGGSRYKGKGDLARVSRQVVENQSWRKTLMQPLEQRSRPSPAQHWKPSVHGQAPWLAQEAHWMSAHPTWAWHSASSTPKPAALSTLAAVAHEAWQGPEVFCSAGRTQFFLIVYPCMCSFGASWFTWSLPYLKWSEDRHWR